jgi:uncharacterized protein (TIGR02466 family)
MPPVFANSSTLAFFPTFVWVYDVKPEDAEALNAAILGKIEEAIPFYQYSTTRHSLQTESGLHHLPDFAPLVDFAMSAAGQIVDFLEYEPGPLRITGCWGNISPPGVHHREHSHPNNFLSGVYYVKVPEGGDTINFHDPRLQAHAVAPQVKKLSTKHAASVNVTVKPGRMVFFPSWLRHSVDANLGGDMRLSIAFNIMVESFAEDVSHPRFAGTIAIKGPGTSV